MGLSVSAHALYNHSLGSKPNDIMQLDHVLNGPGSDAIKWWSH